MLDHQWEPALHCFAYVHHRKAVSGRICNDIGKNVKSGRHNYPALAWWMRCTGPIESAVKTPCSSTVASTVRELPLTCVIPNDADVGRVMELPAIDSAEMEDGRGNVGEEIGT